MNKTESNLVFVLIMMTISICFMMGFTIYILNSIWRATILFPIICEGIISFLIIIVLAIYLKKSKKITPQDPFNIFDEEWRDTHGHD